MLFLNYTFFTHTVKLIIFEGINFYEFSKFHFEQKFLWKKVQGCGQPVNFLLHIASTWQQNV